MRKKRNGPDGPDRRERRYRSDRSRGDGRPRRGSRLLKVFLWLGGAGCIAALGGAIAFYFLILRGLPDFRSISEYRPALVSTVVDRDGNLIGEFFEERRRLVGLDEIPERVVLAFIASEDGSFYEHSGIDYQSIARAAWVDLTAGEIKQGASTITQQTVKSLLLTPERRFERKIKEMVLARRIEEHFSKEEILTLYLNQIYLGSGAYGVAEAGRTYFGKELADLSLAEAALLAGLPAAPSRYSPRSAPEAAEKRRRYVLGRMRELAYIDETAYEEALAEVPVLREPENHSDAEVAAWFTEEVRRRLFDELGGEVVLRGGLRVETTLDLALQRAAQRSVREGLESLDRRQGWVGRVRHVAEEEREAELLRLAEENQWIADEDGVFPVLKEREDPVAGLVVALDPKNNRATVALAPGVEAPVFLADIAWARPRDPDVRPTPRKRIQDILGEGDVARFRVVVGDDDDVSLSLFQEPEVEGALLALDVETGEIRALVGGYDFGRSQFDRAVQARRQPGSAFKPIIYAAAVDAGYNAVTTLYDRPVVYTDRESGFEWRPENYGRRFLGPLPMREALARSVNNATIHLLDDLGVSTVIRFARRLGIRSELEPNLSLALGSSPLTVLELTRAYGVFAAGGKLRPTPFIRRVLDRDGHVLLENLLFDDPSTEGAEDSEALEEAESAVTDEALGETSDRAEADPDDAEDEGWRDEPYQVLNPTTAFLAGDLLRAVVDDPRGTGRRARSLGRPLGGKTGTTNEQGDAWFVGFSRDLVVGVWVGFDEKKVLGRGETGGRAALPVWIDFMREAHQGRPARDFRVPEGITFARVDRKSGKLAASDTESAYFQAFREGEEPTEHASEAPTTNETRRVLRLDF